MSTPFMHPDSRIFVAGHRGLVGSAVHRELVDLGYTNILTRTHQQLDLGDEVAVDAFFTREKPDFVFLAAARVGGILANSTYPADFIRDNLILQTLSLIHISPPYLPPTAGQSETHTPHSAAAPQSTHPTAHRDTLHPPSAPHP